MEVKNLGEIWKITSVALAFIVVSLLAYAMWLKGNNTQLQSEIDAYNLTIEIASKDMEAKKAELPKEIEVIKWKTQQKIQIVKEYTYDENKTDCDNAIALLRRTGF